RRRRRPGAAVPARPPPYVGAARRALRTGRPGSGGGRAAGGHRGVGHRRADGPPGPHRPRHPPGHLRRPPVAALRRAVRGPRTAGRGGAAEHRVTGPRLVRAGRPAAAARPRHRGTGRPCAGGRARPTAGTPRRGLPTGDPGYRHPSPRDLSSSTSCLTSCARSLGQTSSASGVSTITRSLTPSTATVRPEPGTTTEPEASRNSTDPVPAAVTLPSSSPGSTSARVLKSPTTYQPKSPRTVPTLPSAAA